MYRRLSIAALFVVALTGFVQADDDKKPADEKDRPFLGVQLEGEDEGVVIRGIVPEPSRRASRMAISWSRLGRWKSRHTKICSMHIQVQAGDKVDVVVNRDDKEKRGSGNARQAAQDPMSSNHLTESSGMKRDPTVLTGLAGLVAVVMGGHSLLAGDQEKDPSVKEIMTQAHKGANGLIFFLARGLKAG